MYWLYHLLIATAQDPGRTQQMENLLREDEQASEDDTYWQQLDYFNKHPLDINTAGVDELKALNIINDLQIDQLLRYRRLFGQLINLYELQAVPGWDVATIRSILPYIMIGSSEFLQQKLSTRFKGGEQTFLIRYARVLEKAKGYLPNGSGSYKGSGDKLLFRYKYNYKNVLQWGLLGDKDAGEQFFKGKQQQGFDFYSFHLYAAKLGCIKTLVLGDFTVNMGQGLIEWQSMAFGKGSEVLLVKRQSPTLRLYSAAGENNFHRGMGITLQQKGWEATLFASHKKTDGNLVTATAGEPEHVSSLPESGYHRTAAEQADKGTVQQSAAGGTIKYNAAGWQLSINTVYYRFSIPVIPQDDPYNLYAFRGTQAGNISIDYSYTWRNIHLFGEVATDSKLNRAFLHGALLSLDEKMDMAVIYRNIAPAYQSLYGNAFTENARPVNENGLYTGVTIRAAPGITVNAYADVFRFPWLRFRADAPGSGTGYCIQVTYNPNKQVEMSTRYRDETKPVNQLNESSVTRIPGAINKKAFRLQTHIDVRRGFALQNRAEIMWYNNKGISNGHGFLTYMEGNIKLKQRWAGNIRIQYFEAGSYDARIYAFENDVLYGFGIPAFYNTGIRYYININVDVLKSLSPYKRKKISGTLWLRWAQTVFSNDLIAIEDPNDIVNKKHQSECKAQFIVNW